MAAQATSAVAVKRAWFRHRVLRLLVRAVKPKDRAVRVGRAYLVRLPPVAWAKPALLSFGNISNGERPNQAVRGAHSSATRRRTADKEGESFQGHRSSCLALGEGHARWH